MKVSFPYYQSPDGGDFPVAQISLSYRLRKTDVTPLVDSGAGMSLFDLDVAKELGVPLRKGGGIDLSGVGGRIHGYIHTVTFSIGRLTFKAPVVFSGEFDVGVNLLGRKGVFEHFLVTFDEKKKRTIFRER